MTEYRFPDASVEVQPEPRTVYTIANGDLRLSANVQCWPVQRAVEADVAAAIGSLGWKVIRAHDVDYDKGHGFIDSQRHGRTVFRKIPPDAPLVVVEAVWQYSHHVLAGLRSIAGRSCWSRIGTAPTRAWSAC